jgi:hypothetical protein
MDYDRTEKDSLSLTTANAARAGGRPREESNERQASHRGDSGVINHEGLQQRETATATEPDRPPAPLFSPNEAGDLRTRWESIQVGFVDEPRGSVERADKLVAEAISHLAWRKASPRSAKNSSTTGFEAMTSQPRNCGFHCGVIARSSNAF